MKRSKPLVQTWKYAKGVLCFVRLHGQMHFWLRRTKTQNLKILDAYLLVATIFSLMNLIIDMVAVNVEFVLECSIPHTRDMS